MIRDRSAAAWVAFGHAPAEGRRREPGETRTEESVMRTEETYSLMKSAKEIRVAIDADGDRIGGLLNEQHPLPVVEGEPVFDYRKHMQHLVHQLNLAVDDTVTAEDTHSAQLIRVSRAKTERDEIVNVSYEKLVWVRDGLESLYKRGGFELAFVAGDTPRVPGRLLEQMVQTVKLLREPAVEPREIKVNGFDADLETVAAELESDVPKLRGAIGALDRERKQAEGTLVVKRDTIKALRRTVLWVGRTAEGLFHLAGEDELARRIRSSTRRPLRPSEKAAEQQADADADVDADVTEEPSAEPAEAATPTES